MSRVLPPSRSRPLRRITLAILATLLVLALAIVIGGPAPVRVVAPPPGPRLLLTEQVERHFVDANGVAGWGWGDRLVPVDPLTLAPLPGYAPVDLDGHAGAAAVSPDGRTLATFVLGPGPATAWTLHLLDLARWHAAPTAVTLAGSVRWLGFAADGEALFWLTGGDLDPFTSAPLKGELGRYDPRTGTATTVLALPYTFGPDNVPDVRPLRGDRLGLYGVPVAPDGWATDAPHLLVVDLPTGRVMTDLRLGGVRAGRVPDGEGPDAPPTSHAPGLAWDVARDRLYVAHADEDRVTVVDLAAGVVRRQEDIRDQTPLPTGAGPWETRSAAPIAGGSRPALLSADGRRLFLFGQRSTAERLPDGRWRERIFLRGIRVVNTTTPREVGGLALGGAAALSPDGRRLLVHTARYVGGAPSPHSEDFRLYVFDAASLAELGRLDTEPGDIWFQGFSLDGHHAYLAHLPAWVQGRPSREYQLAIFDLEGRRFVAERAFAHATRLIPLWEIER